MQIEANLNNEHVVFNAAPEDSLMHVLRQQKLYKVKCGCEKGHCGNCMVLMDDKPVPSCIIPIGAVRNSHIVTLEHFKTYPEYSDIMTGFKNSGITLCGYCDAGKILTAYSLLKTYKRPNLQQIEESIKYLDCCCTDRTTFINGILYAIAAKHKREGKELNGKK